MTVEVPTKAEHEAVAKTAADALERSSSVAAAANNAAASAGQAATAANNAATAASQASASASGAVNAVGALPPATPMGAAMTVDQAITVLHEHADGRWDWDDLDGVRSAFRIAVKAAHPDHGGDPETFRLITEARDVLLNA